MFFVKSIEPSFERKQKFVFFYCSQCKCPHFPYPIHTSPNKFTIYQLRNGTLVLYSTVILLHTDTLFSPYAPAGKKIYELSNFLASFYLNHKIKKNYENYSNKKTIGIDKRKQTKIQHKPNILM